MTATAAESPCGGLVTEAVVLADPDNGKYPIKDKDAAMAAAFAFLREKVGICLFKCRGDLMRLILRRVSVVVSWAIGHFHALSLLCMWCFFHTHLKCCLLIVACCSRAASQRMLAMMMMMHAASVTTLSTTSMSFKHS